MHPRIPLRLAAVTAAGALLLIGATQAPGEASSAAVSATTLRVNTQTNPIGLGDASPELSWRLTGGRQTAYEIRVASSAAQLEDPDLWDSGKVASSNTSNIAYAGAPLSSRKSVAWDVRVWDGSGAAGEWSAPASWEMGLLVQRRLVGEVDREPRLHVRDRRRAEPAAGLREAVRGVRVGGESASLHDGSRPVRGEAQRRGGRRRGARAGPDVVLRRGRLPHLRRHVAAAPRARTCSASRPAAVRTSASAQGVATSSRTTPPRSTARRRRSRSSRSRTPTAPSRPSPRTRAGARDSAGRRSRAGGRARTTTPGASRPTGPRPAHSTARPGATPAWPP